MHQLVRDTTLNKKRDGKGGKRGNENEKWENEGTKKGAKNERERKKSELKMKEN